MTVTGGFLLKDFGSLKEYETTCRRANEIGVLVWKSDRRRIAFVDFTTADGLKSFMMMGRQ